MNHNDRTWRDHRDELFDRIVKSGRARKRRRGFAVSATLLAVVLALGAALYLPGRDDTVSVVKPVGESTTVPARTGVLLIGDQVMLGAKSALEDAIAGAEVDAVPGRAFGQAVATLDAAKRRGALPPTIVIHLGDNGPSGGDAYDLIGTEFTTIMDTIGSDPEVYFVSVTGSRAQESLVNNALYGQPRQFANAHVLSWQDFSRSHADWFLGDSMNLTPPDRPRTPPSCVTPYVRR